MGVYCHFTTFYDLDNYSLIKGVLKDFYDMKWAFLKADKNIYKLNKNYMEMVLQYKLKKDKKWKDYPGKDKLKYSVRKYDFRLLNEKRTKILVEKGNYEKVMKRFRQIEFFKHRG